MAKNKDIFEIAESEIPDGFLTLKEAAALTKYTPDYIGQLVRSGKIEGRQIYSNVSWVTSEASLREYLGSKGKDAPLTEMPHADLPEFARPLLYIVIGCSVFFLIILIHVLSVSIDHLITSSYEDDVPAVTTSLGL